VKKSAAKVLLVFELAIFEWVKKKLNRRRFFSSLIIDAPDITDVTANYN
jgi:hypothetical protein